MTAPRIPRHTPIWCHTVPGVHTTAPGELHDELDACSAPAAHRHQACPPCTGDCQQGRSCPADRPQDAGDWSMAAVILMTLFAALLLGPIVQGVTP